MVFPGLPGNCSTTVDVASSGTAGYPLLPSQCLILVQDIFRNMAHSMQLRNLYIRLEDSDSQNPVEDAFFGVHKNSQLLLANVTLQV